MSDAAPLFSKAGKQVLAVLSACIVLAGGGAFAVLWASAAIDERAAAQVGPVKAQLDGERKRGEDHEMRLRRLEEMAGDVKATRALVEQLARERRRER